MGNRNKADIDLIFKHTHADFKSDTNGIRTIMYPAPLGSGRIEDMPEEAYQKKLKYSKWKEAKAQNYQVLLPIMKKFNLIEHFNGTEQWRNTQEQVLEYASWAVKGNAFKAFQADITNSNLQFPGELC